MWTFQPRQNLVGIAQRADEADSSGQPATSVHCPIAHAAGQSRAQFPGIWSLALHPGFGFWLFKVGFAFDFDCRPRSSRVQWQTASSPAVTTPLLIARALTLRSHPTRRGSSEHFPNLRMRHILPFLCCVSVCAALPGQPLLSACRPGQTSCQPLLAATRSVDSR